MMLKRIFRGSIIGIFLGLCGGIVLSYVFRFKQLAEKKNEAYIAVDGEFRLISMFDRYACSDRGGAMNYANLAIGPSSAVDYYLNEVHNKVVNMFKSLGFKDGLYFMQGFSNGNKIIFYEMGCRLGGSYYDLEE